MRLQHQPMVEIDRAELGRRIQKALTGPGKSVKGMAKFAGISVQAVYRWKKGKITKENLLKVAQYTETDISYFYNVRSKAEPRSSSDDLAECLELLKLIFPPPSFNLQKKRDLH
jgi:transcriptional regulator with XRE-family HTH domain